MLSTTFKGDGDGAGPTAGLILDGQGVLYGTTLSGGIKGCALCGTAFKLTPSESGYTERVLHRFRGGPNDGNAPYGGLLRDGRGALYGTTSFGGSAACASSGPPPGCGTVFELTPLRTGYVESILHNFQGGAEGNWPESTLIANDRGSLLFGTTTSGGVSNSNSGCFETCGTIFELRPQGSSYTFKTLHRFSGNGGGAIPIAGLISDGTGRALLGTTETGGVLGNYCPDLGCGTVFEITP